MLLTSEVARVFESVDKVGDTRKRISVLNCMRIDVMIVLAGTEHAILLWDKEEGGHLWELGRKDLPFVEILIIERLEGLHFFWIEQIVLHLVRDERVVKFDGVVKGSVGR